ncbi:OmpA family protein [uncultured Dokdonia sp.]|uniref:OmpA family protein n=1 Tax=uncultured Dokdonia sp. TaxID=575653 RepID=UPI002611E334|nr:OmpA family protein [uncultured Dokdonia sp.]
MLVCIGSSFGQQSKLARADKKFAQYAYIDAIEIYKDLAAEGYESFKMYTRIADAYYYNARYTEAQEWYTKISQKYKDSVSKEFYFRYSQSLRAVKEYAKADEAMHLFASLGGEDYRAKLFIEQPDYVSVSGYKKSDYKVDMIREINSRYSDFGPSYYKNQLVFASARDTGVFSRRIHKWNNQPFLDLYWSTIKKDGSLTPPTVFVKKLNTKFHESTSCFSEDGNTMYFTRNNYTENKYGKSTAGVNKLKIYITTKTDKGWSRAEELPFNNKEYSCAHPALSKDGKFLYFASDMPGTIGNSDIWRVALIDDEDSGEKTYGTPENIGRPVNTEGRESFPYISDSGHLYFASDGHPGLGGLDIYVTHPNEEEMVILSLGNPINSSNDDFAFIVNDSTKTGFFSSSRKSGMGSDDIYKFVQKELPDPTCDITITGVITDQKTKEIIPDAKVQLLNQDNELVEEVSVNKEGRYSFMTDCNERYIVRASADLYYSKEVLVTNPSATETLTRNIELENRVTEVNLGDDLAKLLDLKPIYFDFNKSDIRPDAAIELLKIVSAMRQIPTMKISARSHTDSRGRDAYNLVLSDRRAKSTVAYIISKGIDADRITGKGYGEKELVNECSNGVECSEEEHQLNRRSEFIVVSQ